METFARRALPRFIANRCGVPVSIARDAAFRTPIFTSAAVLGYCSSRFPKSPCSSLARLFANRCAARCRLRPRGDGPRSPSSALRRFTCAQNERIGSHQNTEFSGLRVGFRACFPFTSLHSLLFIFEISLRFITLPSGRLCLTRESLPLSRLPLGLHPLPGYPFLLPFPRADSMFIYDYKCNCLPVFSVARKFQMLRFCAVIISTVTTIS